MPWKRTTLSKFLPGANAIANQLASSMQKKLNSIMLLKAILQMFLSGVIDKINSIQALIAALEAQGFYVILLSPSKGNWANRLRFAPNAPPESTTKFKTTGVCVITTAPSFNKSIQAFMSALGALKSGIPIPNFGTAVIKQRSMHTKPRVPKPAIQMDVWKSLTLADLFPGVGAAALDLSEGMLGFLANLRHTIEQISAFAANANKLTDAATTFVQELNDAGAYAVFLKPENRGIVDRLVSEDYAPTQDNTLFSVGFCACFYSLDENLCKEKYTQLCSIFNSNIEYLPEVFDGNLFGGPETYPADGVTKKDDPLIVSDSEIIMNPDGTFPRNELVDSIRNIPIKIKSWTSPAAGYYKDEVWVLLQSNVVGANIYYTLNGKDPRSAQDRKLFVEGIPIHVTRNNSSLKHYAQKGIHVERRTRESMYHIVHAVDSAVPYSPLRGVVAGVGVTPNTNNADFTIPPNTLWGTNETSIVDVYAAIGKPDPDLDAGKYDTPYLGDAGNLVKNPVDFINPIGVAKEFVPPARIDFITPDDPDEVDVDSVVLDTNAGILRNVEEFGQEDAGTEAPWFLSNVVEKSQTSVPTAHLVLSASVEVYYGLYFRLDVFTMYGSEIDNYLTTDTKDIVISEDRKALEGLIDFPGTYSLPIKLINGATLNLMFVIKTLPNDSTLNEYAPVAHDLHYRTGWGQSVAITMSARSTKLLIADPEVNFLIVSKPQYGVLSGSGKTLTYTANSGSGEAIEKLEYIARNMAANSAIATITIDIA